MKKVITISSLLLLGTLTPASAQCKFHKNYIDKNTQLLTRKYLVKSGNVKRRFRLEIVQEGDKYKFAIEVFQAEKIKDVPRSISFVLKNLEIIELYPNAEPIIETSLTNNYKITTFCTFYCSVSANTMKQFSESEIAAIKIYVDERKIYDAPTLSYTKATHIKEIAACFLQP